MTTLNNLYPTDPEQAAARIVELDAEIARLQTEGQDLYYAGLALKNERAWLSNEVFYTRNMHENSAKMDVIDNEKQPALEAQEAANRAAREAAESERRTLQKLIDEQHRAEQRQQQAAHYARIAALADEVDSDLTNADSWRALATAYRQARAAGCGLRPLDEALIERLKHLLAELLPAARSGQREPNGRMMGTTIPREMLSGGKSTLREALGLRRRGEQ